MRRPTLPVRSRPATKTRPLLPIHPQDWGQNRHSPPHRRPGRVLPGMDRQPPPTRRTHRHNGTNLRPGPPTTTEPTNGHPTPKIGQPSGGPYHRREVRNVSFSTSTLHHLTKRSEFQRTCGDPMEAGHARSAAGRHDSDAIRWTRGSIPSSEKRR